MKQHENLIDIFPTQDIKDGRDCFYLSVDQADKLDGPSKTLRVFKEKVVCNMTIDELQTAIEDSLSKFPTFEIPKFQKQFFPWKVEFYTERVKVFGFYIQVPKIEFYEKEKVYIESQKNRASFEIAKQTLRGRGNITYKDYIFYVGSNTFDSPIIVCNDGDKFGLFVHPNVSNYGFKVIV